MKEVLTGGSDLTSLQKQSSLCFSGYAISLESHFGAVVPLFWLSLALSLLQNLSPEPVPYMGNTWHLPPSNTMNFK